MGLLLLALTLAPVTSARTLLFLDDHPLNLRVNVERVVATPELVSVYRDPHPDLCSNWGYPSVYRCVPPSSNPRATWCMMYESQTFAPGVHGGHTVYMLLAQSEDGVRWIPRDTLAELPNLPNRNGKVRCRVTDQHNVPLQGYDWEQSVPLDSDTLRWRAPPPRGAPLLLQSCAS